MSLTTLITVNAILGAVVVYGLLLLLGHGIRTNRTVDQAQVHRLRQRQTDRLAA